MTDKKLPKAVASYSTIQPAGNIVTAPGLVFPYDESDTYLSYHDLIKLCRHFHETDPIAGTVINRMAMMSITDLRNRWDGQSDAEKAFWDTVARDIRTFFKSAAIEYFVHGLVVPDFSMTQVIGRSFDQSLGRKKYWYPTDIWARNVDHIVLRKRPVGLERTAYVKIPQEDVDFILNEGVRSDGTSDVEGYRELVREFPEYVAAVKAGTVYFPLEDRALIMRNVVSYDDYPQPFLRNALRALQHKEYLKKMDRTIASRAVDAIRHIKIGSDDFPADQDDLSAAEKVLIASSSSGERVFNLFTNHTWDIKWIFPPLDVLVNDAKYSEPNSDIFLAMGFPRVLTVGETARSNSSDSKIALLGPVSTLNDVRDALLAWARWLYQRIGEMNNMIPPRPYLTPIPLQDITALIQFAIQAQDAKAISRDTISQLYGSTFEDEALKMKEEEDRLTELGLDAITQMQQVQEVQNQNNPDSGGNGQNNENTNNRNKPSQN